MNNFTPLSALAGGLLIGLASVWLLAVNGRIAGISGIVHGLFAPPPGDRTWRVAFLAGLLVAGFLWLAFFPAGTSSERNLVAMAFAGLLVGFGARLGGGCTSGHGVCGLGRLSLRSLVAVMVFMAAGMLAVFITRNFF
jgi:uncharacterized membrane protein YedE/YeeE